MTRAVRRHARTTRPRSRKFVLVVVVVLAAIATVAGAWSLTRPEAMADRTVSAGEPVMSFELPDVASDQTFSLADYLGRKEIVIVSYMGWFCPGCQELLVELQGRQMDFSNRDVELVVLGSKPESDALARDRIAKYGITYTLLYDAGTSITKDLGLWSNSMMMPWMGYLIIDKSGNVAANDLQLSEASGAAPANVNRILKALDTVRSR